MSKFIAVIFLALIVGAMAFQSPVRMGKFASRALSKTSVNLSPMEVAEHSSTMVSQFSNLIAADTDFGGYAGPAGALVFIAFIILTLAPPLQPKQEQQ
eukprot:gene17241-19764_t